MKRIWVLVYLLLVGVLVSDRSPATEIPKASAGILDLTTWDFAKDGSAILYGPWTFYWQELLEPPLSSHAKISSLRGVPDHWHKTDALGHTFERFGYATYYLKVLLPVHQKDWVLTVNPIYTAGRIYINGKALGEWGKVETDAVRSIPSPKSAEVRFSSKDSVVEIFIQVSNFAQDTGGIGPIRIGPALQMIQELEATSTRDAIITGMLILMGFYHFVLYLLRPSDRSTLIFTFCCLANAAFTLVATNLSFKLFPNISHLTDSRIFVVSWYVCYPGYLLFMKSLYPKEIHQGFLKFTIFLSAAGCIWALTTPVHLALRANIIFQVFGLVEYVYMAYAAGRAYRNGRDHALLFITGYSIVFMFFIHDVLVGEAVIDQPYRTAYGILIFFLIQSYMIASRFARAFHDLETKEMEIMTLNKDLEQRVKEKTEEIGAILENIQQGIFTVSGTDLTVGEARSKFLQEHFHVDKESANLDKILARSQLNPDERSQLRSAIYACLGHEPISFELNRGAFPKEMVWSEGLHLEVDWSPMKSEQNLVEKFLVCLRDVTELKALRLNSEKHESDLRIIKELISNSEASLRSFAQMFLTYMQECRVMLGQLRRETPEAQQSALKKIFINLHTIKGSARTLGLSAIAVQAHEVEELILNKSKAMEFSQSEAIGQALQQLSESANRYVQVSQEKLGWDIERDHARVPRQILLDAQRILNQSIVHSSKPTLELLRRVLRDLHRVSPCDIQNLMADASRGLDSMARDLGKPLPKIVVTGAHLSFTEEGYFLIQSVFVHVIRNALDHGLETIEERQIKGKPLAGTLTVDIEVQGTWAILRCFDDGRGLDLDTILERAKSKGILKENAQLSRQDIAEIVFKSGFSTRKTTTEISGRGIGLDAVRSYLEKAGGRVELILEHDEQGGQVPFAMLFYLPARLWWVNDSSLRSTSEDHEKTA